MMRKARKSPGIDSGAVASDSNVRFVLHDSAFIGWSVIDLSRRGDSDQTHVANYWTHAAERSRLK